MLGKLYSSFLKVLAPSKKFSKDPEMVMSDKETVFDVLRQKWHIIPLGGNTRLSSGDLLKLSDSDLLEYYAQAMKTSLERERNWPHFQNKEEFSGKKILDVGCGFGFDTIPLAQAGAVVTCMDIVKTNVELVKRLCHLLQLPNVEFLYMENLSSLSNLPKDFDVIWCCGSLINAPFKVIREETQELVKHLKPKGRWIELGYPKTRWEREGSLPFKDWGEKTDGPGTPWMEWYDLPKMRERFNPVQFNVLSYAEYYDNNFNWFDLEVQK